MSRPCCKRRVNLCPASVYFKPQGVPIRALEVLTLALDELEALRLADCEGQYYDEASARMGVSRATFGRIVEAARRKVAQALVHGKALRIEGGNIETNGENTTPQGDGNGPMRSMSGQGRGPCGCGQRRGAGAAGGAGFRRRAGCGFRGPGQPVAEPVQDDTNPTKEEERS